MLVYKLPDCTLAVLHYKLLATAALFLITAIMLGPKYTMHTTTITDKNVYYKLSRSTQYIHTLNWN